GVVVTKVKIGRGCRTGRGDRTVGRQVNRICEIHCARCRRIQRSACQDDRVALVTYIVCTADLQTSGFHRHASRKCVCIGGGCSGHSQGARASFRQCARTSAFTKIGERQVP